MPLQQRAQRVVRDAQKVAVRTWLSWQREKARRTSSASMVRNTCGGLLSKTWSSACSNAAMQPPGAALADTSSDARSVCASRTSSRTGNSFWFAAAMRASGEKRKIRGAQDAIAANDQRLAEGAAVHRHKRTTASAALVNVARDQFLAGAGLSNGQHSRYAARHEFDLFQQRDRPRIVEQQGFRADRQSHRSGFGKPTSWSADMRMADGVAMHRGCELSADEAIRQRMFSALHMRGPVTRRALQIALPSAFPPHSRIDMLKHASRRLYLSQRQFKRAIDERCATSNRCSSCPPRRSMSARASSSGWR